MLQLNKRLQENSEHTVNGVAPDKITVDTSTGEATTYKITRDQDICDHIVNVAASDTIKTSWGGAVPSSVKARAS